MCSGAAAATHVVQRLLPCTVCNPVTVCCELIGHGVGPTRMNTEQTTTTRGPEVNNSAVRSPARRVGWPLCGFAAQLAALLLIGVGARAANKLQSR